MINLLPPDLKQAYRAARVNRHLVRWILVCVTGILGAADRKSTRLNSSH